MESRSDRFKRLAISRTKSILKRLSLLSNLSNKSNYEYSEEEIKKIFKAIDDQLKITKLKFQVNKKNEFKL